MNKPMILCCLLTLGLAAGCASRSPRGPVPADPEVARVSAAALDFLKEGRTDPAIRLYREALRLADSLDDGPSAAGLALSLAAVLFQDGRSDEALGLAAEASARAARAGLSPVPAELLRARIAVGAEHPDLALEACRAAEAGNPSGLERAELSVLRSEIAALQERPEDADRHALEADRQLPRDAPAVLRARLDRRLGEKDLRNGHSARAAERFEREAAAWTTARHAPGVAAALRRAAAAWKAAGDPAKAGDVFLRAARSLAAQNRLDAATSVVNQALEDDALPPETRAALLRLSVIGDRSSVTDHRSPITD